MCVAEAADSKLGYVLQHVGKADSRQMTVRAVLSKQDEGLLQEVPVECWGKSPVTHWLLWQRQHLGWRLAG